MKFSVFLLMFALFTVSGFSQGAFLQKGESGFGVSAVYFSNKDFSAFQGSAGYSFKGIVDFGIGITKSSFPDYFPIDKLSVVGVSPFLKVHAFKQGEGIPFSVSFGGSYESQTYSSKGFDFFHMNMKGSSYLVAASIYRDIPLSPISYVQPSFGVGHSSATFEVEYFDGIHRIVENVITYNAAINFVFQPKRLRVVLGPTLSFNKDNSSFGFGGGLVF